MEACPPYYTITGHYLRLEFVNAFKDWYDSLFHSYGAIEKKFGALISKKQLLDKPTALWIELSSLFIRNSNIIAVQSKYLTAREK